MSENKSLAALKDKIGSADLKAIYFQLEDVVMGVVKAQGLDDDTIKDQAVRLLTGVATHFVEKSAIAGLKVGIIGDWGNNPRNKIMSPQVDNPLLLALISPVNRYTRGKFKNSGRLSSNIDHTAILMEDTDIGPFIVDGYYLVAESEDK